MGPRAVICNRQSRTQYSASLLAGSPPRHQQMYYRDTVCLFLCPFASCEKFTALVSTCYLLILTQPNYRLIVSKFQLPIFVSTDFRFLTSVISNSWSQTSAGAVLGQNIWGGVLAPSLFSLPFLSLLFPSIPLPLHSTSPPLFLLPSLRRRSLKYS